MREQKLYWDPKVDWFTKVHQAVFEMSDSLVKLRFMKDEIKNRVSVTKDEQVRLEQIYFQLAECEDEINLALKAASDLAWDVSHPEKA